MYVCVFVGDHVVEDCESIGVGRMLTLLLLLLLLLLGCPTHAPLQIWFYFQYRRNSVEDTESRADTTVDCPSNNWSYYSW